MDTGIWRTGSALARGVWRLGGAMALIAACGVATAAPLKVVTSFSILADMVHEVGGEQVDVVALVGPNRDAHSFEPKPGDARTLGGAQVLVINGLEFETWLPGLVSASGFKGRTVVASEGVKALRNADEDDDHDHGHDDDHGHGHDKDEHGHDDGHGHGKDEHGHDDGHGHDKDEHGHEEESGHHHHGEFDPHAWQNLENGVIYARNIERALVAADPANAEAYRQRANAYVEKLQALDERTRKAFAALPPEQRKAVSSHEALAYFGDAYGVVFVPVAGGSTAAEPSAAELARIVKQVRDEKINALFIENVSRSRLVEQIARETGARVGGQLFTDALAEPGKRGSTYVDMFEWNAQQILDALTPKPGTAR